MPSPLLPHSSASLPSNGVFRSSEDVAFNSLVSQQSEGDATSPDHLKYENVESSAPFLDREISWKYSSLCILADYCQDKVLWVGSHVYPYEEKLFTNCDIYVRKIAQQELMKDLNVLGKEAVGRKNRRFRTYFKVNKWLQTISGFSSKEAVDFLRFRLYVRKIIGI